MEYREKDYPIIGRWTLYEMSFNRCPLSYLTNQVDRWITAYVMFEKGILPQEGGWLSQSNKFIEVIGFISSKINKYNKEMVNKNARK